jgi:hypothetical protein
VAGLGLGQHIGHAQLGLGGFDPLRQLQAGHGLPGLGALGAVGMEQLRIEPGIQFMIPGDHCAGHAGDEQEHGHGQAEPTVEKNEKCTHGWLTWLNGEGMGD